MSEFGFLRQTLELERKANQSTALQWDLFTQHRQRLTALLLQGVERGSALSLCVLGAGNCNDLDLALLLEHYAEVHLVDLDASALDRATARLAAACPRLTLHTGFDLTCALDKLPRWARLQVTPEELIAHPSQATAQLGAVLGRRFDRVLSPCVWTQLQLQALRALGPGHQLLDLVQYTLGLTHLRQLAALLQAGGSALLATELTANTSYDFTALEPDADHLPLVWQLMTAGNVIGVAAPERIVGPLQDDPVLAAALESSGPMSAWLWSQGPARTFLTYACWLHSTSGRTVAA